MHSPQLINEILELKLLLDLCPPSEAPEIQEKIAQKADEIRLISKVSLARVEAVVNSRYPDFVAARHKEGRLITGGTKTVVIPQVPPE